MIIRNSFIIASLFMLTACGGMSDFVRPADDQLILGESKRGDIVALLKRDSDSIGQIMINNIMLDQMEYSFLIADNAVSDHPDEEGFVGLKTQFYYLKDNTLVGSEYYSTFASDSTQFDSSKVTSIIKGKSTKREILSLLGKPSIYMIKPLVSDKADSAIGYHYRTMNLAKSTELKTTISKLVVEFDSNNVVVNIDYESKRNNTL